MSHKRGQPLTASTVKSRIHHVVKDTWKSDYKLCVLKTTKKENEWLVHGVLSKPTKRTPIPTSAINILFKVDEFDQSVRYRLEKYLHWHASTKPNQILLDRIICDKERVRIEQQDIVRDEFGRTRQQIRFDEEIAEERKIAESAKVQLYPAEIDDEYIPDEEIFANFGENADDAGDNAAAQMAAFIEELEGYICDTFEKIHETEEKEADLEDYWTCIDKLRDICNFAEVSADVFTTLSGIVSWSPNGEKVNVSSFKGIVQEILIACVKSGVHQVLHLFTPDFSNTPSFKRTVSSIMGNVEAYRNEWYQTHETQEKTPESEVDGGSEENNEGSSDCNMCTVPINQLFDMLQNNGGLGLLQDEANSVVAQHDVCPESPQCVYLRDDLDALIQTTRLAFIRCAAMRFPNHGDFDIVLREMLAKGDSGDETEQADETKEPCDSEEKDAFEAEAQEDIESKFFTRAQLYNLFTSGKLGYGLIYSKVQVVDLLAMCSSEGQQCMISFENILTTARNYLFDTTNLARLQQRMYLDRRNPNIDQRLIFDGRDESQVSLEFRDFLEDRYVKANPDCPPRILYESLEECIRMLLAEKNEDLINGDLADALAAPFLDEHQDIAPEELANDGYGYLVELLMSQLRKKHSHLEKVMEEVKVAQSDSIVVTVQSVEECGDEQIMVSSQITKDRQPPEAVVGIFTSSELQACLGLEDIATLLSTELRETDEKLAEHASAISLLQSCLVFTDDKSLTLHVSPEPIYDGEYEIDGVPMNISIFSRCDKAPFIVVYGEPTGNELPEVDRYMGCFTHSDVEPYGVYTADSNLEEFASALWAAGDTLCL